MTDTSATRDPPSMTDATAGIGADDLAAYDHVRPTDGTLDPGVYRVVGTTADAVTLLRVADGDGRRRHTGSVHTVDGDALAGFEAATDPDQNRSLRDVVVGQLDGLQWQLRVIGQTVVDRPIASAPALAAIALGLFGDPFVTISDTDEAILFLVGALALLYLARTNSS